MLELDVDKRLTASQALTHPFFEPFRDPEEETEAQQPFDDSLEHEKLTVDEWKRKSRGLSSFLSLPAAPLCSASFISRPGLSRAHGPLETAASFSLSGCAFLSPWADLLLPAVSGGGRGWALLALSTPPHLEPPCLSQSTSTRRL